MLTTAQASAGRPVQGHVAEEWYPGSFTKNFSWGPAGRGLRELYDVIRVGFANKLADVPRQEFRNRVQAFGRPDYIPLNFFLYNRVKSGASFVVVDELVFQALSFRHSAAFDKLALFAFNLSEVGIWRGAAHWQNKPALWAKHYVMDRLGPQLNWDTRSVSADDIDRFVSTDLRYRAATSRKLATNLNYLYHQGRLSEYKSGKPERWWLSALFLALDRFTNGLIATAEVPVEARFSEYVIRSGFHLLSGPRSMQKDLAAHHFVRLYQACGATSRFSEEAIRERQKILVPDIQRFANDSDPVGVVHPSDFTARNALPRACAILANYAGFDTFEGDELDNFDLQTYVREHTRQALDRLKAQGIRPSMTAEEVLTLTRDS